MKEVINFKKFISDWSFAFIFFCAVLFLGPIRQFAYFTNMPGDIVDARLNLIFLENIYAYFTKQSPSLIDLTFFYPFPYVSAFSDNLFGSALVYLLARLCSFASEDAFQFWFTSSYVVNFAAACFSLRLFGQSRIACAIGAIFFTFGLPVSAQMGHAQLQYRFGICLSIAYFYQFLTKHDYRAFGFSCFWLVWQFFCSIYLGFFAGLFIAAMLIFYLLKQGYEDFKRNALRQSLHLKEFLSGFKALNFSEKTRLLAGLTLLSLLLIGLFLPYWEVTKLYRFVRTWMEVSAMSPRISSYLIADHSLIWGSISKKIQDIPIRWEQQLFIGLVPLCILFLGAYQVILSPKRSCRLVLLVLPCVFLIVITLNYNGYSLWYFFVGLPLFSAIRALSRIILLFLFPISIFLAASIDLYSKNNLINKSYFYIFISLAILVEVTAVNATVSPKSDWVMRVEQERGRLGEILPENTILFFAQRGPYFESEELDAMVVAQIKHLPTLNGYSGALPHHFRAQYGDDCAEYPRRILLYLEFMGGAENNLAYSDIASRVMPIGFVGCQSGWRKEPPMTLTRQPLSKEEISQLGLALAPTPKRIQEHEKGDITSHLAIKIINKGKTNIAALSLVDRPLRLAWRLRDDKGQPLTSWTEHHHDQPTGLLPQGYRRDLPGDIPAGGEIEILAPIPEQALKPGFSLEYTLVQEATLWGFPLQEMDNLWAHDLGVTPLFVDLSRL